MKGVYEEKKEKDKREKKEKKEDKEKWRRIRMRTIIKSEIRKREEENKTEDMELKRETKRNCCSFISSLYVYEYVGLKARLFITTS
jgi:predicted nuclease of restriction endonuclease-like (RecB) superfamily